MREAPHRELRVGQVPCYAAFVRHLWTYSDPNGFEITSPPVMYRVLFEGEGEDWEVSRWVAENLVDDETLGLDGQIEWECVAEGVVPTWELRFASLSALHAFCVSLGNRAMVKCDAVSIRVGRFVMWTLGFHWV